jgi:cell migration-inducing and hyaluronan-binding protein
VLIHDGVNDSPAVDTEACEIKPEWNAAVCKGDIGRLTFNAPGGPFGGLGGGPGAGAGGPGGAAGAGAAARPGGPAPTGGAGAGAFGGSGAAAASGGPPAGGPPPGAFGAGGPPQPPVVLSRNGKDYTVTSTNIRAGTEIKVTTERPTLNLNVAELDAGSWVIFELPRFTAAASGAQQSSLDALRKAAGTSYFKSSDALWVKVVSNGDPRTGAPNTGTVVQVSR